MFNALSPINPLNLVDVTFSSKSKTRYQFQQVGGSSRTILPGQRSRPYLAKLVEFEQIALYDATVSFGLFALIDTMLAQLGPIQHPDPDIQEYLRFNIDRMGGMNSQDSQFYLSMYKMIHTTLWAGYSVTETLYAVDQGRLYIDDFATYHPGTIIIRPNVKGRLVEGEDSLDMVPSGIYQMTHEGEKRLPMWKLIHLCRNEFYGNYYGISLIETIYKWHLLKDAFVDMKAIALDRHGNPIVAITVPVYNTNEQEIDPETGEVRKLTTQEVLERQVASQTFSGGGNVLLLPQFDETMKPNVQVLSTGNNVGSAFESAISGCDREISKGLLIPFGFLMNDGATTDKISQRQMELFNRILLSVYRQFITSILSQSFHRLIQMTFSRESAKICPKFPLRQTSRPEDRVALMQVITGLTEHGYFNPTNERDWRMVREMVDANDRDLTPDDVEFVKTLLVYPRMAKAATDPGRDRITENKVKGKGVGAGRPVGTSAPKLPDK